MRCEICSAPQEMEVNGNPYCAVHGEIVADEQKNEKTVLPDGRLKNSYCR